MECPDCHKTNQSSIFYVRNLRMACHGQGAFYTKRLSSYEGSRQPKLVVSIEEYKTWDLVKRCFWAGCGGCMKVDERGAGCCRVCFGCVRVLSNL